MEPNDLTSQHSSGPGTRLMHAFTGKPGIITTALATIAVLAWLDRLSGTQLSLTPLYVIPVGVVAWYFGGPWGRTCAGIAGVAQVLADLTAVTGAPAPGIVAWNALMIFALSTVVGEVLIRLRRSLESERDLARTDPLTGVANARSFHEIAALEIERSKRYGRPFTIACLDLDHFKEVNDTLGHAAGDRLLRDIGGALRGRLRRVDSVARLGGDEFILMLPETSAAPALYALEHIRHILASLAKDYGAGVKASIGAVTFTQAPQSVSDMVRMADIAMYRAKALGRDRVESITIPEEASLLEETEILTLKSFVAGADTVLRERSEDASPLTPSE
jgi:diguanylate cyclase (GGDEF)-like protein